jgi:hypothetical protein
MPWNAEFQKAILMQIAFRKDARALKVAVRFQLASPWGPS